MQALKALILVAAVAAAGAARADASEFSLDGLSQAQTSSGSAQALDFGTSTGGLLASGFVRVSASQVSQYQAGDGNRQELQLGRIDKSFGHHAAIVTANGVNQSQAGHCNEQRLKAGFVE